MARLEYSQIVRRKLKQLEAEFTQTYGEAKAKEILGRMVGSLRKLEIFPQAGAMISLRYGIACDYRYLFAEHHYFFYRVKEEDTVIVLEMLHEREDFMRKLFGIVTTSQETIDYWGES